MKHSLGIVSFLAAVLAAIVAQAQPLDDPSTPAIPEKVIKEWKNLPEKLTGWRGRLVTTRTAAADGKVQQRTVREREFGITSSGVFLKETQKGQCSVQVAGIESAFAVHQDEPEGVFKLRLFDNKNGPRAQVIRERTLDTVEPVLFAGFEVCGKMLPDLVGSPHFTLKSLSEDKSQKTATLTFEYSPPEKQRDTAIAGGSIQFQTEPSWLIKSYDCPTFWGRMKGAVEYREIDGTRIPARTDVVSLGKDAGTYSVDHNEITGIERLEDARAPLHLADYGLQTPE